MALNIKKLMLITASTACLTVSSHILASSTDVVLNLEGNPTCSSLGDNQAVLNFRDTGFVIGVNEATVDTTTGGTQTITYEIGDVEGSTGIVSWSLTGVDETNGNPINFIILKTQGNKAGARVYHYGASTDGQGGAGAIADDTLPSRGANLSAVSFCYGLTTGFTPPDVVVDPLNLAGEPLPACEELDNSDLFTTQITCPDGGEEQLIINLALNKTNFGFDFGDEPSGNSGIRACTCNADLPACNPALSAQEVDGSGQYLDENGALLYLDGDGEFTTTNTGSVANADNADLTVEMRSCLEYVEGDIADPDGVPAGVNEHVPFSIQGVENPDSYVCYVWNGRQYCYGHY